MAKEGTGENKRHKRGKGEGRDVFERGGGKRIRIKR